MMRSMYSGVAGLKTHQTKMDVIGNNIANVNTVAYKSQSVTFNELMYQTTQAASGANATTGTAGINARQIGLGVKTGAINTNITAQGATQTTNNPFDIRITGDAFFIVSNGLDNFFTRDGSFYVDGQGNLAMTSNGYNVMGWQVDPQTQDIKMDTVSALRVMSPEHMTYPPEATTKAYVSGILDKNDVNAASSSGKTMNLQFYDKLGYSYTAKFVVKTTDVEGVYTLEVGSILDSENNPLDISGFTFGGNNTVSKTTALGLADGYSWDGTKLRGPDAMGATVDLMDLSGATTLTDAQWETLAKAYGYNPSDAAQMTTFKSLGYTATDGTYVTIEDIFLNKSIAVTDAGGSTTNTPARTIAGIADIGSFETNVTTAVNSSILTYDATTGKFVSVGGGNSIDLNLSALNAKFENITVDFSNTTMYNNGGTSTITATNGDTKGLGSGRKIGKMTGISIQDDGRIYASYDNGQSKLLGQIAVAEFSNASGLSKEGDNLYKATQNSGEFDGIGVNIKSNGGYMTTGVLEMSNVDLSAEFTEMITTQRGFQANSRIITVSDTLLEELVNLKR